MTINYHAIPALESSDKPRYCRYKMGKVSHTITQHIQLPIT